MMMTDTELIAAVNPEERAMKEQRKYLQDGTVLRCSNGHRQTVRPYYVELNADGTTKVALYGVEQDHCRKCGVQLFDTIEKDERNND